MRKELTKEEKYVREELSKLYPQLQENCKNVLGAGYELYGGDLLPVAIEMFLNKPIEVQLKAFKENKAENFITYIMNFQAKMGKTTYFYGKYKKHSISQREYYPDHYLYDAEKKEDNSDDDLMYCLKQSIKHLDPFEKMLVQERIIKGMGYEDIVLKYNIPYSSISNGLQQVKRKLKKLCIHYR